MLTVLLTFGFATLAYFIHQRYTYWARMKIPHIGTSIPFGVLTPVVRKKCSVGQVITDIYTSSQEKVVGINLFTSPALLVRDVELVHQMLTSDFGSFHDRGTDSGFNEIFSMRGQDWRTLRAKLTPSFTSGKLKGMLSYVNDIGDRMVTHINKAIGEKKYEDFEMKDLLSTYAIDIIGSVIFGLDVDTFSCPENEFAVVSSTNFNNPSLIKSVRFISALIFPFFAKLLPKIGIDDPHRKALESIVERTIKHREQNHIIRKDLLQLLIQLRNTGKISDDDHNWDIETTAEQFKEFTIRMITEQCFIFYLAGVETTAFATAYTIYELSMYPDLLKRAQAEVFDVLQKHDLKPSDKLTYEAVQDMKFLDLCLMETTRKYPGLPFLSRECTKDYKVPGENYTIKKGTPIVIPINGIQRDSDYFPNPNGYDPERFLEERRDYNPKAYMPFGEGPRQCIAMRMGKINSKIGVIKILANFNIINTPRREIEFKYDVTPALAPKDGIHVKLARKV